MIYGLNAEYSQSLAVKYNGTSEADSTDDSSSGLFQATFEASFTMEYSVQSWGNSSSDVVQGGDNVGYLVTIDQVNKDIKKNYLEFTALFNNVLEEAGIRRYPDFEVFADNDGSLYIESERSDKESIEDLLNSRDDIKDAFLQMSESAAQAAAMERLLDFAYRFGADPQNSGAQYCAMYNRDEEPLDTFSLEVTELGFTPKLYSYGREESLGVYDEIAAGNFDDLNKQPSEL